MYSYEERLRAVRLYIKLGKRMGLPIRQLWVTSTILTAALTQRNCYPC